MSNGRGTHDVVDEPGETKITAIQRDTTYVVVSFYLTHMGTLSIVLPR